MSTRESAQAPQPKAAVKSARVAPENQAMARRPDDALHARRWIDTAPAAQGTPPRPGVRAPIAAHGILQLQRVHGNRQVQRLLEPSLAQPRAALEAGEPSIDPNVEQALMASKGSGAPLHGDVRNSMEHAFGADFGSVRAHTGADAAAMTSRVGAQALTHGSDIWFGDGAYAPESPAGRELLAHELTHTVQQGASAVHPPPDRGGAASATVSPRLQAHWYNVGIPFTDYEFDPSLEGLKTAGGLAADKAKEGVTAVGEALAGAAGLIVDKIKGLIESGIQWLTDKFESIKAFAVSSFDGIKAAVSGALSNITNPLGLLEKAMGAMDVGLLSAAWSALTSGANAAWQVIKGVVNGVLDTGSGLFDTVAKYVDSMFGAVGRLMDNRLFNLLPDAVQSPIRALYDKVHALWTTIRDFWMAHWKRLTTFARQVMASVESFVKRVTSFLIANVVATVRKLKEAYDFARKIADDPGAAIDRVIALIAGRIRGQAPGKARDAAQHAMAEAASQMPPAAASAMSVQRAPELAASARRTGNRTEINAGIEKELSTQWGKLDIAGMLKESLVNLFWPPATIRAIGKEFSEMWNTDWKNAADGLFAPRSIVDDFGGFWEDVWSNFLVLLDFPMALWRRLNNVVMLLMGYVTILLILGGLAFGPEGAAAGAALAWAIGEALFASFLAAESINVLKIMLGLYTGRHTEMERARDYQDFAAGSIGIGIAVVVAILFSLLGAFVREVIGRIKGAAPKVPPPPEAPKQLGPGPEPPKQVPPTPDKPIVPGDPPGNDPAKLPPAKEPTPEPPVPDPAKEPPAKEPIPEPPGPEPAKGPPAAARPFKDLSLDDLINEGQRKAVKGEKAAEKAQREQRVADAKAEARARGYCFVQGTPVQTADGPRPIETVRPGQVLLTRTDDEASIQRREVLEIVHGAASVLYHVEIDGSQVLTATAAHPFLVVGKGWTSARDLAAGDRLHGLAGDLAVVTAIESERLSTPVPTFNLHVDEIHAYFVGDGPAVLVHNGPVVGNKVLGEPLIWGLSGKGPRARMPREMDVGAGKDDLDGASGWRTESPDEVGRLVGVRGIQESQINNHGAVTPEALESAGLVAIDTASDAPLAQAGFQHVSIREASNPDPTVDLTLEEKIRINEKLATIKVVAQNKAADFLCV